MILSAKKTKFGLAEEVWTSASPTDTTRLAKAFAKKAQRGDVIGLVGPLGAGKTFFIKGFCQALGMDPKEVLSPTFTLIHHYRGTMPVYHFDAYRLESDREFEDLGYEEQFYGDGVSVVEWADKVFTFLPAGSRILEFSVQGEKARKITCYRKGGQKA